MTSRWSSRKAEIASNSGSSRTTISARINSQSAKLIVSRRRSHTLSALLALGRLGPLSLQCLQVARGSLLQQLPQSTSVIQSALHLGHKLFGHVDCNPPPLLPAVQDVTSMLLPDLNGRTTLAHADCGESSKSQAAPANLQPANDIG